MIEKSVARKLIEEELRASAGFEDWSEAEDLADLLVDRLEEEGAFDDTPAEPLWGREYD